MQTRVLSLDIASTTGWAFLNLMEDCNSDIIIKYGVMKVRSKDKMVHKLFDLREKLKVLLEEFKPTHVVMEDIYLGLNPKTLVMLAKLAGVVEECCLSYSGVEPYIIHTSTVKSFYKLRTKKMLFDFIISILEFPKGDFFFKQHNDVIDAIAQLLCYCDAILGIRQFRYTTEYGFLYKV